MSNSISSVHQSQSFHDASELRARRGAAQAERIDGSPERAVSFGCFQLFPAQRLLLNAGKAVLLGSRALDVLIALVGWPGELISKDELMAHVWPSIIVHPGNLTVHITALRRALGDCRDGNRFIVNVPGRGYQFVAAIRKPADPPTPVRCAAQGNASAASLSI